MSESSTTLHEPAGRLSDRTVELHRALVSLQEELEAVDWYRQRADACRDEGLRAILEHNMNEEIEHACMILEWLRRNHGGFAARFDDYLYSEGPITDVEEAATAEDREINQPASAREDGTEQDGRGTAPDEAFTVGPMKERS